MTMKYANAAVISICLIVLAIVANQKWASRRPRLVVEPNGVSFGVVEGSTFASKKLVVENRSNDDVQILKLMAGCGCTQATTDRKLVRPGDKANITVGVTGDETNGQRGTYIALFTDHEPSNLKIPVSFYGGKSRPLTPTQLDFGQMFLKDLPQRQEVRRVQVPGLLAVNLAEATIIPPDSGFKLVASNDGNSLNIELPQGAPNGIVEASLRVPTTDAHKVYLVPLHGVVLGDWVVSPPELFRNSKNAVHESIQITTRSGEARRPRSVSISKSVCSKCVTMRSESDSESSATRCDIEISGDCDCVLSKGPHPSIELVLDEELVRIPVHFTISGNIKMSDATHLGG